MNRDPVVLETLEQTVIDIITKYKKLQPGVVTIDSTFADLSIDSLDGMELLFEFEERFDLTIPDDIARDMRNVRQVVDALRGVLTSPAGEPPQPAS